MKNRFLHQPARFALPALFALALAPAAAQPPPGYYDSAEGLSGQALRAALHNIIDNQNPISYAALWTAFQSTDAKPGNIVWDMYSDVPGGTPAYVYTYTGDQCGNYNSEADCYNREHSFPESWFNGNSPMYTDLFHIYPTDGYVNNRRGNLPFGDVGSADWTSTNQSKVGLCIDPGYSGTVFEPIDAYKGDFARSYFYMMTRYYGQMAGWNAPVVQGGDLIPWARAVLLQWNDLDPVSAKETARNNAVYGIQGNRNPFIDHPEWVHAIWDPTAGLNGVAALPWAVLTDQDGLHLRRASATPGEMRIRDLAGRTVARVPVSGERCDIPLSAPAGIYLAELITDQGRTARKFAWIQ